MEKIDPAGIDDQILEATMASRSAMEDLEFAEDRLASSHGRISHMIARWSVHRKETRVHNTEENLGMIEGVRALLASESIIPPAPISPESE